MHRVVDLRVDEHAGKGGVASRIGIEGRLAHQAMHAGFGAQDAVRVRAAHLDGRALDSGHFAGRFLEQFGFEILAFGVAQVHALQHGGPVLRFGAAGAGLDVQEAVVRIQRIVEHALEFQLADLLGQRLDVDFDRGQRSIVRVGARHFEQFRGIAQVSAQSREATDHILQRFFLAAQFLCAFGIVPDLGVFERLGNFGQALLFGIDVKDTSAGRPGAFPGRPAWQRFGSVVQHPWRVHSEPSIIAEDATSQSTACSICKLTRRSPRNSSNFGR